MYFMQQISKQYFGIPQWQATILIVAKSLD